MTETKPFNIKRFTRSNKKKPKRRLSPFLLQMFVCNPLILSLSEIRTVQGYLRKCLVAQSQHRELLLDRSLGLI